MLQSLRTFHDKIDEVFEIHHLGEMTTVSKLLMVFGSDARPELIEMPVNPAVRTLVCELVMETMPLAAPAPNEDILAAMDNCGFDKFNFTLDGKRPQCIAMHDPRTVPDVKRPFRARTISVNRGHRTAHQALLDEGHRPATLSELLAFLTAYPRFPFSLTAQGTMERSKSVPRYYIAHHDDAHGTYELSLVHENFCTPPWTRHLVVEYDD